MCDIWFFNTCLKYFWILIMSCRFEPRPFNHQWKNISWITIIMPNYKNSIQKQLRVSLFEWWHPFLSSTWPYKRTLSDYGCGGMKGKKQKQNQNQKKKKLVGKSKNRNSSAAHISIRIIVKLSIYRWQFQFSPINHSHRSVFGQFADFPCCVKPKKTLCIFATKALRQWLSHSVPTCALCSMCVVSCNM